MEYFSEVLDRSSGELQTVSMGDWVPVTEFGASHGLCPRKTRTVLRQLGVLQVEGAANHVRHRLAPWVVERRWGKRIEPKRKGAIPFDVLGPDLQSWIVKRLEGAIKVLEDHRTAKARHALAALDTYKADSGRYDLSVPQCMAWLAFHFPDLTQDDVASILDVSRQLVSKYQRIRDARLRALAERKAADPDDLVVEHRLYQAAGAHDQLPDDY